MNTLTIFVLVVCATMAYASVIPDDVSGPAQAAQPAEIFQAEESAYRGGGRGYYGGGGGRGYYGGGGRGYYGGGGRGYYGGGGRGYYGGGGGGRYRGYYG